MSQPRGPEQPPHLPFKLFIMDHRLLQTGHYIGRTNKTLQFLQVVYITPICLQVLNPLGINCNILWEVYGNFDSPLNIFF